MELWDAQGVNVTLGHLRAGHPEVAINSLKNKRSGQQTPAANIKKSRKGDVNFCPNIPSGETRDGLEVERVALLTEVKKKKKDEAVIKEKMQRTFSLRRQEILQEPKIPEFLNKWPALFDVSEINLEFMRLTTVPLTSKFLGELDRLTDDLIRVFHTKGGAAGRKIRAVMAKTDNNEDINVRRDCVLSCLSIYLNEDLDTLVKEYMEVNPHGPEELEVKGRVLAPKRLQYASDDNSAPNKKDACCGLSAYELKRLENIRERDAFLSSLKSKASLDTVQSLLSPRKSLHLKEARNLTLRGGLTYEHDIECREAEADVAGTTMAIYTVRAESDDPDGPGGRFADVGVVLEGVEVLHNLQSINHACVMLYGLIYALNLSYPKSLKNTFEVYQKILMDLESSKLSPEVQALKLKLLG
ncbi:WD repeat-containing protein 76 [Dissostichus eleginoides]|uniref:WD repeat-containing protein 76 n=1 Tax=Dissostichus eleginoides TaxID=100907 RepID=A0AAD9BQ39_DISEL|nr:WD repeat-containing protein 76 [Dissostichus eleginoides]